MPTSLTIATALKSTAERLAACSDAAEREAHWLLEHLTGHDHTRLLTQSDQSLSDIQQAQLGSLIERRVAGEPLGYVLGNQPFWTLELEVSPAVLIPRADTELVVERALAHLPKTAATSALDLGTGSGAIALALASERPAARILATDQSMAALQVAERNAQTHHLHNVRFQPSDWFVDIAPQLFDVITSNPPYIAADDPHVQAEVHQYEPHLALYAGTDGLDALRIIVREAPRFLHRDGWLVLEHGWQQAPAVRALLESAGFSGVASHADLAGHLRVTEAQWPGR